MTAEEFGRMLVDAIWVQAGYALQLIKEPFQLEIALYIVGAIVSGIIGWAYLARNGGKSEK